jgi:hypothetical protein
VAIPGCTIAGEASTTSDGQQLYFACRVPETGRIKIMHSVKQEDGSWGVAALLD